MTFTLSPRARSKNFDLIDSELSNAPIGQVVCSVEGYTVYLHGELEALLPSAASSDEALADFKTWAASNSAP